MRKIIMITLSIHCVLLLFALLSPSLNRTQKREKPLTIRSYVPKAEEKIRIAPGQTPRQPKKSSPRKTDRAAIPAKKGGHAKAPSVQKKNVSLPQEKNKVPEHLLRELEETIAKIDDNREILYSSKKLDILPDLKTLSDTTEQFSQTPADLGYRETLVLLLKESLNLPDYGEVKVDLTLDRKGNVKNIKIIKTDSEKNRTYLESHLFFMQFPPLSGSFNEKNEHTYTLTFCNEI